MEFNRYNTNSTDPRDPNSVYCNCPYCQRSIPVILHGFALKESNLRTWCVDCRKFFVFSFKMIDFRIEEYNE